MYAIEIKSFKRCESAFRYEKSGGRRFIKNIKPYYAQISSSVGITAFFWR